MTAHKNSRGFTLIETVVAIGVFSIFIAAVAFIVQQVLENVAISRLRAVALSEAQEQMELIRNLPYTDVGTVGASPSGPLEQVKDVIINGATFTVTTSIIYIDDPFDGVAPTDIIPADYKRVRIQVTWNGFYPSRLPVTLVSNIVPKGIEANPGGGTLILQVFDSQGNPVPNASVHLTNSVVVPSIDTTVLSDENGKVTLPGYPACLNCYSVSVTKTSYSTDKTYDSSEVANPLKPTMNLLEGSVSQQSFTIDRKGRIVVSTRSTQETGYVPVGPVLFTLVGNKIIGFDEYDEPVHKFVHQYNAFGGIISISDLEWDTYQFDLTDSTFTLVGSTPIAPISVLPGDNFPVTLIVDPKYAYSLQVTVLNSLQERQASATAKIKHQTLGTTFTKVTPSTGSADLGQVLFNNLTVGVYDLVATLSGYIEATASVTVNTNQQMTVVLNPYIP